MPNKKIACLSFLCLVLFISPYSSFAQGTTGLVAHWTFSGNAIDSSGNGLNGTITGATPTTGYSGVANTALLFNGTGDHIDIPYKSIMNMDSFSICVLIKPLGYYSGTCQGNFILMRGIENNSDAYCFQYNDEVYDHNDCTSFNPTHEQFVCEAHAGGPAYPAGYVSGPIVDTGKWYCLVATYDRDSVRMYIDGALVAITNWGDAYTTSTDGIGIGYYPLKVSAGYPYWYNGKIDDIRLYNRVLSSTEAGIYCDSAKMPPAPPPVTIDTIYIEGSETGCKEFKFNAISINTSIATYNWEFGDGATGTGNPVTHSYAASGTYTVDVVTIDTAGIKDTAYYSVTVPPVSSVQASGDTTVCYGESAQLFASGCEHYIWSPKAGLNDDKIANPLATPDSTTTYVVTGTDSHGCISSDSVIVKTMDCTASVGVPSAFSPNGDGVNDILYVRGVNIRSVHLVIYNRWGQKVFETNDMNKGWDGTFRGKKQPIETYAYVLKAVTVLGREVKKKGSVTLLR